MKKIKLLPIVLMLVLCVGIFAVGIYAIKPSKNKITGTITVNASNQPVTIKIYNGLDTTGTPVVNEVVRAGKVIETPALGFVTQDTLDNPIATINDVAPVQFTIVLTTTSTDPLVVDTETVQTFDEFVETGSSITPVKNLVGLTKYHEYDETYTDANSKPIACFSSENEYKIVCTFRLGQFTLHEAMVKYNIPLNIYKASEFETLSTYQNGINGVDYLYFGEYPQSEASVTDPKQDGEFYIYDITNGYNSGLFDSNNYGVEADGSADGQTALPKYTKNGESYVLVNSKYYKIEPIKWNILNKSNGEAFIVSDLAIDLVYYRKNSVTVSDVYYAVNEDGTQLNVASEGQEAQYIYANNYEYSDLRSFLNTTFYTQVFNLGQKISILSTEVDNSVSSTNTATNPYVCNTPTEDYVFALSHKELVTSPLNSTDARKKQASAFAKERGVYCNGEFAYWRTRSPYSSGSDGVYNVRYNGEIYNSTLANVYSGCVPALNINLK